MTKAEIIAKTLGSIDLSDEPDYQTIVIAELNRKLPEGREIKTCEDFHHLNVKCCESCHDSYPHYSMRMIDLPDGSPAWVCCAVSREYRKLKDRSRNSSEGKLGEDMDDDPKE
jgi:hypothetical protein